MPTKIVFDNATIADAVNKASRIAPTKGPAFDRASGILIEIDQPSKNATIKSTDLEVTFMQDIPFLEGQGDNVIWRIPSTVLADIVGQLKMGQDNVVEFIDRGDGAIRIKSNRLIAKLAVLDASEFPRNFTKFPAEGMIPAGQLGQRVEQVAWAVDHKSQILGGVHIDGKRLIGCNYYTIATIPCEVALTEPVTVPLSSVAILLKQGSDVRCRAVEKQFQIMLDEETRTTTTVIAQKFPDINPILREDFIGTISTHRQSFVEALNGIMVLIRQERLPRLRMEINGAGLMKLLTFDMEVPDLGRMQNSIDVSTDYLDIYEAAFAPKMVLDAVSNSRAEQIWLDFGHPDPAKSSLSTIRIRDEHGYQCYVSTKKADS